MEVRAFFGQFVWRGINIYDVTIHPFRGSRINPTLKVCEHNRVAHASQAPLFTELCLLHSTQDLTNIDQGTGPFNQFFLTNPDCTWKKHFSRKKQEGYFAKRHVTGVITWVEMMIKMLLFTALLQIFFYSENILIFGSLFWWN